MEIHWKRAVVAALFASSTGTQLEKGPDFVLHAFPIYSMATTALSMGQAICCYRCPSSSSDFVKCSAVTVPSFAQPYKGSTVDFGWSTANISIAGFSTSQAILCYQETSNTSRAACTALEFSGSALSRGPQSVVNPSATGAMSVAALTSTRAVSCYRGGDALSCQSLTRSGLTLSKGSDLMLNLERPLEISMARVSDTKVAVCWQGASSSAAGKCLILVVTQSSETQGATLPVSSTNLGTQRWHASVVALSPSTLVLCYQDVVTSTTIAKCNALRLRGISGTSLDKGSDLLLSDGSSTTGAKDISVSRLSNVLGIVCYRGGLISHYTTCNSLNLFGNSLSKGADVIIQTNGALSTSTSSLNSTSVLACYRAPSNGNGVCNVVTAKVVQPTSGAQMQQLTTLAPQSPGRGTTNGQERPLTVILWPMILAAWVIRSSVLLVN